MTPTELTHLHEALKKTQNWSYHKKSMHGIATMYALYMPDFTDEAFQTRANLVTKIIRKMLKVNQIKLRKAEMTTSSVTKNELRFIHQIDLKNKATKYIFNRNAWIELLDKEKETFALIVTGGFSGKITFYSFENGQLKKHKIFLDKNGVFKLEHFTKETLLFTNKELAY